jgi:hypothetical protein
MDAGLEDGVTWVVSRALRDVHRRIMELEKELTLVKAASGIFDARSLVDPKGSGPSR